MDGLDTLIAERLRLFLANSGMRHQDLANAMNVLGFRWTANLVTQVVTGRRALSLLELAGICTYGPWDLGGLIGNEGRIELPEGAVSVGDVWPALQGDSRWAEQAAKERGLHQARAAHGEATVKAARRLGINPWLVERYAHELWDHALDAERDRRVGPPREGETARALQARRGHVTRALVDEIRHRQSEDLDRLMRSQPEMGK